MALALKMPRIDRDCKAIRDLSLFVGLHFIQTNLALTRGHKKRAHPTRLHILPITCAQRTLRLLQFISIK